GLMHYRYLLVVFAITSASCAYLNPGDPSATGVVAATDAMSSDEDETSAMNYDVRDDTIEVVAQTRIAQPHLEERILQLVNRERESAGVGPLNFSPELARAARYHSAAMADEGFFEHRGGAEPALFERVTDTGMDTDHVGENIFETSEGVSGAVADECVQMWMHSEGHRRNMLSPEFDKTGIAVSFSRNGENYITEDFAH
ncbi:MAG TPA: CAP domain-containing protein, partial [Candidatus Binataceae bacterium]|nr:CAP domain-containing protein [Candidatus Binataceae bacterium]